MKPCEALQDAVPHWGDVRVGDHNPAKVGCSMMGVAEVGQRDVGRLDFSGLLLRRLEEDSIGTH